MPTHVNDLTRVIIGAAIEVHRHLGPGLLESVYESAICLELKSAGLKFVRQAGVPVLYKGELIAEHEVRRTTAKEPRLPMHDRDHRRIMMEVGGH